MSEQRWEENQARWVDAPEPHNVVTFDYEALDDETRSFVQQKAAETHVYLKRTTEAIIQIGQNLLLVKQRLEHGYFMAWLQAEFGLTYQTARNYMRVAERLGDNVKIILTLPSYVLYLPAQPSTSQSIIEQVEAGHLPPTPEAIKAARQAEQAANVQAEQAAPPPSLWQEQAKLAEARWLEQQQALQAQISALQEQVHQQAEPKTIIKEVVPKATEVELAALREKLRRLSQERDALSKQAEEQARQAQKATLQEDARPTAHMSTQWQRRTQETLQLLIGWPSPLDADHFRHDDWRRLSQVEEAARRLQHACVQLRETRDRTVSADVPTNETGEDNEP
jgi:hypothetical protein